MLGTTRRYTIPFPDTPEDYTGPEREPPLWAQFDQLLKTAHRDQPVVVNELMEIMHGLMYRLRYRLMFEELVQAVKDMLAHNERHITSEEWLLTDEDGMSMPLITPELRRDDPERAALAEDLLRMATNKTDISPEDFA